MFEKATIFSAVFVFVVFGIIGIKYFDFLESKSQVTKTSMKYEKILNYKIS